MGRRACGMDVDDVIATNQRRANRNGLDLMLYSWLDPVPEGQHLGCDYDDR